MNLIRRMMGRGSDAAGSAMDQATVAERDLGARLAPGAHAPRVESGPGPVADLAALSPEQLGKFQEQVDQLDAQSLQSAVQRGLSSLPAATHQELFNFAQRYLNRTGAPPPQAAAVGSGDESALARVVTTLLKQGPGDLALLFQGTGAGMTGGASTAGIADSAGFGSLLDKPLARQVHAALIPAIVGRGETR
jgi:hypothetical protein